MNKLLVLLLLTFSSLNAYLAVTDIAQDGLSLKLDDGAEWDIQYFGGAWKMLGWGWIEQKNVAHWTCGDDIEIQYPQSGNLTDFFLVILNLSKQEQALAYLRQAPSVDHPACLWIVDFDKDKHHVTLSDGTKWVVSDIDMYGAAIYATPSGDFNWEIGDPISTIRCEGWMFADPFLLWNHVTNQMPWSKRLE